MSITENNFFDKDATILYHIPLLNLPIRLSTIKYVTFLLSGMASLWPWNCFLSASDYFQDRFSSSPILADNYSSSMMTVSTITSTLFNYYLSRRQQGVNYTQRLKNGNYLQMVIFVIMTLSVLISDSWTVFYFVFVMINVLLTSIGSCLTQVGMMALVNVQGSIYANATVVGNAIAGVLPSIAMIVAVMSNPTISLDKDTEINTTQTMDRSFEAVKYFTTSVFMAILARFSIFVMEYYEKRIYLPDTHISPDLNDEIDTIDGSNDQLLESMIGEVTEADSEFIGFKQLWSKLKYVESTIIITFALTLIFPVFAANVESNTISKKLFIPLAFLVWNVGDLLGRIICASPLLLITSEKLMITYSLGRICFIPLFLMCNIRNRGGSIGDIGYLLVQLFFGLTNGQLFSSSYMRIGMLLDTEAEQSAAAAFTALLINISLLAGSLASFVVVYAVL